MYSVLDKDIIKCEIVPYLPLAKSGFQVTVPLEEIVNAVLYKLKKGVQWYQLPVKSLFDHEPLSWQSVYYHYRKWCKTGVLKKAGQERNLTQEQLGQLVGVKKAQISKLESSTNSATIDTILKVFKALKADINFNVTIEKQNLQLT